MTTLMKGLLETGRVSCPVIDMHAHMFPFCGGDMIADTPEEVMRFMRRANVRMTTFVGHTALFEGPHGVQKDLAAARKYPNAYKLYYPVLSPLVKQYPGVEWVDANRDAYVGFKFLCDYYKVELSDERHASFFEYADAHKLPILVHTWGGSPYNGVEQGEKVLKKYRNLTFVAGHSFFGMWDEAVRLAKEYDNLYLEMTAVLSKSGGIEPLLAGGMGKRLLFGVDAPWFSYDAYIGALISVDMTDDQRRDLLYRNAMRVFNKAGVSLAHIDLSDSPPCPPARASIQ